MEVVASLSQGRTVAAQCGLFTHKSVPVIFEPPCIYHCVLKIEYLGTENRYKIIIHCLGKNKDAGKKKRAVVRYHIRSRWAICSNYLQVGNPATHCVVTGVALLSLNKSNSWHKRDKGFSSNVPYKTNLSGCHAYFIYTPVPQLQCNYIREYCIRTRCAELASEEVSSFYYCRQETICPACKRMEDSF